MGYLLKEALKTLCGVNQWAYAVFWKIGCQNPKLLIWEECYYESASWSNGNPATALQRLGEGFSFRAQDKVHSLVDKMMADNHFNIVGEGLVGRVAFTGNHQWILSENYCSDEYPPEVLKEVCQQFAAGMQTVAVIPALPHGVVQFGSFSTIMENPVFVKDATLLLLELGYVSGTLLSEDLAAKEHNAKTGVPIYLRNTTPPGGSSFMSNVIDAPVSFNSFNYVGQTSMVDSQMSFPSAGDTHNGLQPSGMTFPDSNSALDDTSLPLMPVKLDFLASNPSTSAVRAEVIPSNSEMWMNQHASAYLPMSALDGPSRSSVQTEHKNFPLGGISGHFNTRNSSGMDSFSDVKWVGGGNVVMKCPASDELKNVNLMKTGGYNTSGFVDHHSLLGYSSAGKHLHVGNKLAHSEVSTCKEEVDQSMMMACDASRPQYEHTSLGGFIPGFVKDDHKRKFGDSISSIVSTKCNDSYNQPESGDDLFDVLGADFKSQLFSRSGSGNSSNESIPTMHQDRNYSPPKSLVCSEMYCTSQANSDSGIFSSSGTDNLLEAVVTKVHVTMDDNVSSGTTLTSTSRASVPNASLPYSHFGVSEEMKGELFGFPKCPLKVGETSSCSLITGATKEESGTYSQGSSSIYGSQISMWIQKNQKAKPNNSVSTGYSKKPETGKTTRRRLKPGENPRPRPKDRQMIQDRVKELREIVPNGAKCSIDSLLERTIKHMLFLQSVTKHADKLKQTGESKIISKDGGLLLKDNFEGGATWAYEVGSQSMVCPIIVEDLNQSRQMLVEMLCEERGLFLEIADIIRGLGLTILKGVMETRNDKIWARFAVEANRDVTRMEIFISLVRLLEQSSKTGGAQENIVTDENHHPMAAHQYLQGTPIPVPGGSHSLQ